MNTHKAFVPVDISFHKIDKLQKFRYSSFAYLNSYGSFGELNSIRHSDQEFVKIFCLTIKCITKLQSSLIFLQQEFTIVTGNQRVFEFSDSVRIRCFDGCNQLTGSEVFGYHIALWEVTKCRWTIILIHHSDFHLEKEEKINFIRFFYF